MDIENTENDIDYEEYLIQCVEGYPMIYDKQNPQYCEKELKKDIWRAIARHYGETFGVLVTDSEIESKWKELKTKFAEVHKKLTRYILSGSSPADEEHDFPLYKQMLFLTNSASHRRTESNYTLHSEQDQQDVDDSSDDVPDEVGAGTLKLLLSFAVGGLLGDVFLHLLPEAWASRAVAKADEVNGHPSRTCGLWVLIGFLVFIIAEKMFINEGDSLKEEEEEKKGKEDLHNCKSNDNNIFKKGALKEFENNNCLMSSNDVDPSKLCTRNSNVKHSAEGPSVVELKFILNKGSNGFEVPAKNRTLLYPKEDFGSAVMKKNGITGINGVLKNGFQNNGFITPSLESTDGFFKNGCVKPNTKYEKNQRRTSEKNNKPKHISGYLNLMANCIDNFTHGLAVGGSFLISFRLGALTTFAILVHEIPHEVGDFAILLRSGFNRWDAARAQLLTATGGIFGSLVAVLCSGRGVESRTSWILPFTAGGFLHIGMVSVLPELLKETNPKESLKQLGALLAGITIMAFLTMFCD